MKNHKIVQYSALDHTFNCLLLQLRGYKLFYFYFIVQFSAFCLFHKIKITFFFPNTI